MKQEAGSASRLLIEGTNQELNPDKIHKLCLDIQSRRRQGRESLPFFSLLLRPPLPCRRSITWSAVPMCRMTRGLALDSHEPPAAVAATTFSRKACTTPDSSLPVRRQVHPWAGFDFAGEDVAVPASSTRSGLMLLLVLLSIVEPSAVVLG